MLTVEISNGRSACNWGVMCEYGTGVDKTILEARELYGEARRARVALAACNVGVMYKFGTGVEKQTSRTRVRCMKRRTVQE